MSQWASLGVGLLSLGIFGHTIKKSLAKSKDMEESLHVDPSHTQYLSSDDDLRAALLQLKTWRNAHPETFDTIVYRCNALLGVQFMCDAQSEGYQGLAAVAHEHYIAIVMGLDVLRKWIVWEAKSDNFSHFDACSKEIISKCDDFLHNINVTMHR
jgi:hypothetical protein